MLATIKNDLGPDLMAERAALITLFNSGGRGAVMYRLADDNAQTNPINNRAFIDAEYNRAFVATQYFGYLRRDPDMAGFLFWLGQVNGAPLRDVTKAARDGLLVHHLGGVSAAIQFRRDAHQCRMSVTVFCGWIRGTLACCQVSDSHLCKMIFGSTGLRFGLKFRFSR